MNNGGFLFKRTTLVYVIALCLLAIVSLRSCSFTNKTEKSRELYAELSRAEKLEKCISCHNTAHENEKIGPHANAFLSLMHHQEEVNRTDYKETTYTHFVNESISSQCVSCHSTQNLFESNYKGLEFITDLKNINSESHPSYYANNQARIDSSTWITGIDCITCHYTPNNIIASASFVEKPEDRKLIDYCFPKASMFLSSDIFCSACHKDNYNESNELMRLGLVSEKQTCNSCHQEYKNGKGTHYLFWRKDPKEKINLAYNNMILNGFNATLYGDKVIIDWTNNSMPHKIGKCRDFVTLITISDNNGRTILYDTIRLNRREEHALDMVAHFGNSYQLPGINGIKFEPFADTVKHLITLPKKFKTPLTLTVAALNKSRYWADDSTGDLMAQKTIILSEILP